VNGQLALPLNLTADVELTDFDLPTFLPYLRRTCPCDPPRAASSSKGTLRLTAGATPAVGYAGGLGLSGLRLTDARGTSEVASLASLALAKIDLANRALQADRRQREPLGPAPARGQERAGGLKGLEARGFSLNPGKRSLALSSLALRDVNAEITLAKDGKLNLTETLATVNPPPAAAKGGTAGKAPPPAPTAAQKPAATSDSGIKTHKPRRGHLSGGTHPLHRPDRRPGLLHHPDQAQGQAERPDPGVEKARTLRLQRAPEPDGSVEGLRDLTTSEPAA
jgi:hypothetical protein